MKYVTRFVEKICYFPPHQLQVQSMTSGDPICVVGFVNVDTFYNFVTNICVESKITRVSEATKFIAA
jgi:hypothetical protein